MVWQGSAGDRRPYADQVLGLYRKRSGEGFLRANESGAPERFRYSDLKEAVLEWPRYGFLNWGEEGESRGKPEWLARRE